MSDRWSAAAQLYRESEAHRRGRDLDLLVAWARGARAALDVASGGGHVARRLRQAGMEVVTCDPAPGMQPDVICRAEDLPFADESFDVVACRIAPHHFPDLDRALTEMARVSSGRVLIVDNLYLDEQAEEAERVRDPTHVRNYTEEQWRDLMTSAKLVITAVELIETTIDFAAWLERAGCRGEEADRVRSLVGTRLQDGRLAMTRIAVNGAKP
jgi:ubiquinone/menaquinone biosynthesis C-methylase UbiE